MSKETYTISSATRYKEFWKNPQLFATTLLVMFLDVYEMDGVTWTPETIQMEIQNDFSTEIPDGSFDRLMTAINLLTSDSFFVSLPDFVRDCVVLSGHQATTNLLSLPDSDDIAWGVTEAMLLSPIEEEEQNPFNAEITSFIGMVLDEEGILNPPDILRIATRDQSLVDRVNFEFSEDPEMFSAINKFESEKTDHINRIIRGRMRALIGQLQSLPIKNGNTAKVAKKMLASLPGDEDLPLPI